MTDTHSSKMWGCSVGWNRENHSESCPTDEDRQSACYSGKKTHSIKNNLLCIGNLRIVWLSSTYEGHWSVHAPKKPKGKELITAEKQENRRISGIRIKVEHAIGGMKKCRIVKERFRCHKFGFEDMVILIACGLHNFRITHKMSHITI